MHNLPLHISHTLLFSGSQSSFDKADFVVLGVPFDNTSTYRTGARFAPNAIRDASLNIETYSFRSRCDVEDLGIHDLGDLHVSNKVKQTLTRLEDTVKDLANVQKTPVLLGGEHTITLGATRAIGGRDLAILSLDAHLDLRDEYMDVKTSHTTFMRRLHEQVKPKRIVSIGTRAVCREELDYAEKGGIPYFTTQQIQERGSQMITKAVKDLVNDCQRTYVTIDMDVLDPAFAPGVQNPEPNGLSTQTVLKILSDLCGPRLVGVDLVEVTPPYDQGLTAITAARILFETLCHAQTARSR